MRLGSPDDQSRSFLAVDDDPAFLQVVPCLLMRSLPHGTVEPGPSARVAASKLAEGHYDAAMIDLMMPDLGPVEHRDQMDKLTPNWN